jgi:hypothetical protein
MLDNAQLRHGEAGFGMTFGVVVSRILEFVVLVTGNLSASVDYRILSYGKRYPTINSNSSPYCTLLSF